MLGFISFSPTYGPIAEITGFDYVIAHKERRGDKQVEITLPAYNNYNKPIVIIDDMASTGRTIGKTAALLRTKSCKSIYAVVTHPLFCEDAVAYIRQCGVETIWSTDSIDHPTACIKLDFLLAETVKMII